MNAQKAKAIADEAKIKGIDVALQRSIVDEMIRQNAEAGKYDLEFNKLHPDNTTALKADGFIVTQRTETHVISWK